MQKQEQRKQCAPRQQQLQTDLGPELDAESTQRLQQVDDVFHLRLPSELWSQV